MKKLIKCVCVILALVLCISIPVAAAEITPYASSYFMSNSAYLTESSSSSFKVWFSVTAKREMDKLGVDYIDIERSSNGSNWSVVKTYDYEDYSSMMGGNTSYHSGSVTYSNKQSGYQYRAYVHFYAKDGSGSGTHGVYAYF